MRGNVKLAGFRAFGKGVVLLVSIILTGCENRSSETFSHSPPSLVTVEEVTEMVSGTWDQIKEILPEGLAITETTLKNAESGDGCIFRFKWVYNPPRRENWFIHWGIDYFESGSTDLKGQDGVSNSENTEYVSPKLKNGKVYIITLSASVSAFDDVNQSRYGKIILRKFKVDLRNL